MSAITLSGVSKRYGSVVALEDVTLEIDTGTVHALVGPNGSGKTTLLRLIAGIERPTTGRIDRGPGTIGVSFQQPRVYPELTVDENIDVFAGLAATTPSSDWIDTVCDEIRLTPARHRRAGDLSGGFAKKLDLALALLKQPDILLLDEPVADIDDSSRADIQAFIGDYKRDDRTILLSTHDVDGFKPILDRTTRIVDGHLRADEPPGSIGD